MGTWKVTHRTWGSQWDLVPISSPDQSTVTADVSTWTPGKPGLTLHASPDKSGPIIAVCHFEKLGGGMRIGIGDPTNGPQAVQWTEMSKTGWTSGEFTLPLLLEGGAEQQTFTWTRTRSIGNPLSSRSFKLTDGNGQGLAVFESKTGWSSSSGTLEIMVTMAPMLEHMVFITILSIQEKIRKNATADAATSVS